MKFLPTPPLPKNLPSGKTIKYNAAAVMQQTKKNGPFVATDHKDFKPDYSPTEVLQAGAFGKTYFRTIDSSVVGKRIQAGSSEAIGGLPESFKPITDKNTSSRYLTNANYYKKSCGSSLDDWESSGWIQPLDPYGWFQWYCRFFYGRRSYDDERQIGRWKNIAGRTKSQTSPTWTQARLHWALLPVGQPRIQFNNNDDENEKCSKQSSAAAKVAGKKKTATSTSKKKQKKVDTKKKSAQEKKKKAKKNTKKK